MQMIQIICPCDAADMTITISSMLHGTSALCVTCFTQNTCNLRPVASYVKGFYITVQTGVFCIGQEMLQLTVQLATRSSDTRSLTQSCIVYHFSATFSTLYASTDSFL